MRLDLTYMLQPDLFSMFYYTEFPVRILFGVELGKVLKLKANLKFESIDDP